LPYQNTRFQTRIAEAGLRLSEWSLNPWRKLSLLLLTFLVAFLIGVGLGSITGALDLLDLVAAVLCVLVLELSIRARGVLRRGEGDRLALHLVDMARMGLLYGLLLEGFKLL
jgi:di/tricarboxylate transporter